MSAPDEDGREPSLTELQEQITVGGARVGLFFFSGLAIKTSRTTKSSGCGCHDRSSLQRRAFRTRESKRKRYSHFTKTKPNLRELFGSDPYTLPIGEDREDAGSIWSI